MSIYKKLENLFTQYQSQAQQQTNKLPLVTYDEQWPSPCEISDTLEQGQMQWQAVAQQPKTNMDNLGRALEMEFHPALSEFYGSFYGDNLAVRSPWGKLLLLQAWSETDFDQLQQNITGHILMKRKLKQDDTIFIGLTEQDDLLLTVENSTGSVWLEYVGKPPHEKLAASISDFLSRLEADFQ